MKNKFNISISEIGDQDVWQNLHLGIVAVGSDPKYVEGLMRQVVAAIDNMQLAEMTDNQVQVLTMGPETP